MDASEWPLIARIYADEVYRARYNTYLAEVTAYAFETSAMQSAYETYSVLIEPYATAERSGYSFLKAPMISTVQWLRSNHMPLPALPQ